MQFIGVMMIIVAVFLTAIFTLQYFSSARAMEESGEKVLETALDTGDIPGEQKRDMATPPDAGKPVPAEEPDRPENRTPVLVLRQTAKGSIIIERNDLFFLQENDGTGTKVTETMKRMAEQASGSVESTGILKEYAVRFRKQENPDGEIRMAFADISGERENLRGQIRRGLLISAGVFLVLFLLSLVLSDRVLRPVARAWDEQQQFVADASHELKTPLAVIISNADLMEKSPDPGSARNRKRLDHITTEAARMKELVEELLEVARGEAGSRKKTEMTELSLSDLTEDTSLVWEPLFFESGRGLDTEIGENISVRGNGEDLRRALEILLDNAKKYSPEDSVIRLSLSFLPGGGSGALYGRRNWRRHIKEKNTGTAVLSVTSGGRTLTPEEQKKVFQRFYRGDPTREAVPGYGLGLTIAAGIAAQHGGTISVSADPAGGNIFTLRLPAYRKNAAVQTARPV